MRIAVFSSHDFEKEELKRANKGIHQLHWLEGQLNPGSAELAKGCEAVIVFANDDVSAATLEELAKHRVKYITTRSTGYNHIDLQKAKSLGIKVAYVPEYSPYAIAEHAVGLMLALNRHLIESNKRVSHYDFHIEGLTGFDMRGRTVGIIGTGNIGTTVAGILHGFGCKLLGHDVQQFGSLTAKYGLHYVSLEELCKESDIITLHVPLNKNTQYLINAKNIALMKDGVMLINTSRGRVINTKEALHALKINKIGYLGLDVYENENPYYFKDMSSQPMEDKTLKALIAHPNALVTAHHAFLTRQALKNIADATFYNINCWDKHFRSKNELV